MKKSEDAKIYYRKAVEIDPNDAEAYYSIGVIDWVACFQTKAGSAVYCTPFVSTGRVINGGEKPRFTH